MRSNKGIIFVEVRVMMIIVAILGMVGIDAIVHTNKMNPEVKREQTIEIDGTYNYGE